MFIVAASLITPTIMEEAGRGNPWYFVLILAAGIAIIAKKIYSDMKNEKKETENAFALREDRLIKIDEEHRVDAKEREKEAREREEILLQQIRETNAAHHTQIKEITDAFNTQIKETTEASNKIAHAIDKVSETQELMLQTQKETVEAVRHLNDDFREIKKRMARIESQNNKESA